MRRLEALQAERALCAAAYVVESAYMAHLYSLAHRDTAGVLTGARATTEQKMAALRERAFRLDIDMACAQ